MCRNIRTLFNFEPPATDAEIRAACTQFVRKISGSSKPSQANAAVFSQAVDESVDVVTRLLSGLVTTASPRDRKTEATRARGRAAARFARRTTETTA